MKTLSRILCLVFLAMIICIGGVCASWSYTGYYTGYLNKTINVEIGDFIWQGSEVLPDEEEVGKDHVWLVNNILDGDIGLNNPDSKLNDYINDRLNGSVFWGSRNYFGSMAVTGSAEIEEIFGIKAKGLSFIVEVDEEDSNVYYLYTTDVYLGEKGEMNWLGTSNKTPGKPTVPIGEYIEVIYRTKLVRANESAPFETIETKKGKALSDWYDENRSNANATQIPAFDVNTWVEIK